MERASDVNNVADWTETPVVKSKLNGASDVKNVADWTETPVVKSKQSSK